MSETATPRTIGSDGPNPHTTANRLNEAATELVLTHGPLIMRDALQHSANAEDADDAYQRALEILLTKAPSTDPDGLVPWLRVVVRNEALDIARARSRSTSDPLESIEDSVKSDADSLDEIVVRSETAGTGAEALERLTHDQVHCLLAYAQGNSYGEISEITGFTARKVTRCVTDGRRSFTTHFTAIESGSECERLEPLLQRMADGDSFAHVEARPHLRNCAGCRATLRAYREAPSRIAVLFPLPLVAAAATPSADVLPGAVDQLGAAWSGLLDRVSTQIVAFQHWIEAGTAKKLGTTAAVAAVLTAGGVAAEHSGVLGRDPVQQSVQSAVGPVHRTPTQLFDRIEALPKPKAQPHRAKAKRAPVAESAPAPTPAPIQQRQPSSTPIDDGSSEFLPEGR